MEVKKLKEALNNAYKHTTSNKNTEEKYHSFIFDKKRVITVNTNYSVEIPCETEIQAIAPSEETMKIISRLDSEKIIFQSKKTSISFKTPGVTGEISCYEWKDELLNIVGGKNIKWEKLPEDFNEGIKLCVFSASRDVTSVLFNAVYIKGHHIQSTDNFRISRYQLKDKMKTLLLPLPSAVALINQETTHYSLEENQAHFKNKDGSAMHCRILEASEYPDVTSFFELKKKDKFSMPSDLSKTISLVSVLAEGDFLLDKKIKVVIQKGIMKCRAENETGWIESSLKIKTDKNISFMINPIFFLEILKLSSEAITDGKKIIFNMENFSHFMMLMDEGE